MIKIISIEYVFIIQNFYYQFCREDGASAHRLCFLSSAKIGSQPADSSQIDAECVRFQGADTEIVLILRFNFSFNFVLFCLK